MGKFFAGLILSLAIVSIGGFVNYQRNAHLDQELEQRPYASLSDEDLDTLKQAYEGERQGLQNRLNAYPEDRTGVMDGFAPADLGGKLDAFDSFQRKNKSWRDTNRERLSHEIDLDKLNKEKSVRTRGLHIEHNRVWRRLTTF